MSFSVAIKSKFYDVCNGMSDYFYPKKIIEGTCTPCMEDVRSDQDGVVSLCINNHLAHKTCMTAWVTTKIKEKPHSYPSTLEVSCMSCQTRFLATKLLPAEKILQIQIEEIKRRKKKVRRKSPLPISMRSTGMRRP